jgi:hypothetical protein
MTKTLLPLLLSLVATSCTLDPLESSGAARGKADTGWVADTSFEIGADLEGKLIVPAAAMPKLASDRELQEQLVDRQIAFGKNALARHGYHLNQLVERVTIRSTEQSGETITIAYAARVDLIREKESDAAVPALEELSPRTLSLSLPENPDGVYGRAGESCAGDTEGHGLAEYNYYYYFAADKEGCDEPLAAATLSLREVYAARVVYPEYDRLLKDHGDGTRGFSAAILPNLGDDDPAERFARHKTMLEDSLKLTGEPAKDGSYVRYLLEKGKVRVRIDLYDPRKGWFTESFRKALGRYELVFYNGHSAYGTQPFLADAKSFAPFYQIIMMHSCRSYPYYSRQVFRAKATDADPTGFENADMVATGESSSPYDSPRTLRPLLESLFAGVVAVDGGEPERAPSWLEIVRKMNAVTWDIYYGAAGVRSNRWQPAAE